MGQHCRTASNIATIASRRNVLPQLGSEESIPMYGWRHMGLCLVQVAWSWRLVWAIGDGLELAILAYSLESSGL